VIWSFSTETWQSATLCGLGSTPIDERPASWQVMAKKMRFSGLL
jgi:hypothetical protein